MKEFKLTNLAVDNKSTVYIFTIVLIIFGIMQYMTTPKEKFPEIVGSTVYIEQELVVDELKRVRAVLDRIARKGGLASAIQR